jgi:hypothetical protein
LPLRGQLLFAALSSGGPAEQKLKKEEQNIFLGKKN